MASKLRVDEIVNSTDTGAPSIPNAIRWQRKQLGSNVTSVGVMLQFNGLTVGRRYRLTANLAPSFNNTSQSACTHLLRENGNVLETGEIKEEGNVATFENIPTCMSTVFTATGTTCDLYCSTIVAAAYDTRTSLIIEELPFHAAETTDFT